MNGKEVEVEALRGWWQQKKRRTPHRVVKSVSISEGRIEREQLDLCSQAARVTTDKEEEGLFLPAATASRRSSNGLS